MEEEVCCLNQFFRPKLYIYLPGIGDCTTCTPDKDNINCKNYNPVAIFSLTVIEKE